MTSTLLKIFVKPNARRIRYWWLDKDILKVDVPAPSEDNKANTWLIKYLSNQLQIDSELIKIKGGKASRYKFVLIQLPLEKIKEKFP
jgi:uncharacterized protein (TIGR00251 family)